MKIPKFVWLLPITLALPTFCGAASDPPPTTHYLRAQEPTTRLYAYSGIDWSYDDEERISTAEIPIELRLVTPNDYEFAVRTSGARESGGGLTTTDASGTTVTLRKGFRPRHGPNYLSIESGYRLDQAGRTRYPRDSYYATARIQGGYTRLGFDASATWNRHAHAETVEGTAFVFSLGYRGQFKRLHVGLDVSSVDQSSSDESDRYLMGLVAMWRFRSGAALYGSLGKRFSTENDDPSISFGYEHRFELP